MSNAGQCRAAAKMAAICLYIVSAAAMQDAFSQSLVIPYAEAGGTKSQTFSVKANGEDVFVSARVDDAYTGPKNYFDYAHFAMVRIGSCFDSANESISMFLVFTPSSSLICVKSAGRR